MVHKMKPAQPFSPPIHTAFLLTDCFDFMAGKYLVPFPSVVDTLSSSGSVEAADSSAAKEADNSPGGLQQTIYRAGRRAAIENMSASRTETKSPAKC